MLYPVLDAVRISQGVSVRLSTTLPLLYDRQVPFCDRHHISCFGGFIRFHFLDVCSINMPVSRLRFSTLIFGSHQLHDMTNSKRYLEATSAFVRLVLYAFMRAALPL